MTTTPNTVDTVGKQPLGQIERCDVRSVWANEAADFTPWLAKEENMALLAESLGIEMEVENIEVAVGPYSADILAKNIGTDRYVVIENQLDKTNHDHLGKAITYGSVLDAGEVIWIAPEFTEEHRKALEWLNDNTGDNLGFYGVQVELWRIDNSRPAVRFNVVSRPAEIVRQAAVAKAGEELTDARKLQLEFWTRFREKLLEEGIVPSAQTPRPQYWFDVALGRGGISLSNIANTYEGRVGVRVYISNTVAEAVFPQLEQQKAEIEHEIGEVLQWNPHPDNRDKIIALYHEADIWDRDRWDEYIRWLVDAVARFRKAFMPRVKKLKLTRQGVGETTEDTRQL